MKKYIATIGTLILIATIAIAGGTFAWRVAGQQSEGQANVGTGTVEAEVKFKLDDSQKGIPGESKVISKENTIVKTGDENLAFMIRYSILDADSSCIDEINLINSELDPDHIKIKKYEKESSETEIVYLGKVYGSKGTQINIGEIEAVFKDISQNFIDKYDVKYNFIACQTNEAAVENILGIKISENPDFNFLVDDKE